MSSLWRLYRKGGITPAITSLFDPQNAQQMAFIRSMMKEQRKDSFIEVPLQQLEVIVFDLETTGFLPYQGDEIISIGAVAAVGTEMKQEEQFYTLVNPKRSIPPVIEQLTGITNEQAMEAPSLMEGLRLFFEFAGQRVLIAHGSGHDKQFLNAALWKTSKVSLTHRMLDTLMLGKRLRPKLDGSLDRFLEEYAVPVTLRHHALEDALMTAKLWGKFIEELQEMKLHTLGDLYAYLSKG